MSCHELTEDDTLCASVVAACQSSESLLSSCVPYGELDPFSTNADIFHLEVDTYRAQQTQLLL